MEETFTCDTFRNSCADIDEIISVNRYNEQWKDDATWSLTSSFVILTMQSGFGLLEIGASTAGNEVNTMLKNVADILFGALAFYCVGYGIAYGSPSNWFMGLGDFFPDRCS
jgi:ammonia channel protein AmtB